MFDILNHSGYSHPHSTEGSGWLIDWMATPAALSSSSPSPEDTFNYSPVCWCKTTHFQELPKPPLLKHRKALETSPWWKRCQELCVNEIHSSATRTVGGSLRWLIVCSLTCVFCWEALLATHVLISSRGTAFHFGLYRLDRKRGVGVGLEFTPVFLLIKQSKYLNYSVRNQFPPSTSSRNLEAK